MFILSSYRIFKFAWESFWRNIWLSIVTITVILLALISINFLYALNVVTDSIITTVKDRISVSVFFMPEIVEADVLEVKTYLDTLSQVESIEYISAKQALDNFIALHQDDPKLLESISELDKNPLGATLNVKAVKLSEYPSILEILDNSKYKNLILSKNFDDHKDYIDRINQVSNNIQQIGFAFTIMFIFISFLIVFNTIRIAIYTHRNEIGIMKLVGATNNFIRSPFLLEAVFDGIIAAVLSIALLYPILSFIQPYLTATFIGSNLDIIGYFNLNFWKIFGLEILAISLLNIIGAGIAIRKYLDV
ncbi:ABC transporter permease [Patescibacteria group bacterium]|nr:ABC transporter permease [Patescibacteria group bacterium]